MFLHRMKSESERSQEAQCPPVGCQAQQKAAVLVLLGKWSQYCLGPLSSSVTGILKGGHSCNHRVPSYPDPRGKGSGLYVVLAGPEIQGCLAGTGKSGTRTDILRKWCNSRSSNCG